MKIALQIEGCTCLRSIEEGTINSGGRVMMYPQEVFDSRPKKEKKMLTLISLNLGNDVYTLMP